MVLDCFPLPTCNMACMCHHKAQLFCPKAILSDAFCTPAFTWTERWIPTTAEAMGPLSCHSTPCAVRVVLVQTGPSSTLCRPSALQGHGTAVLGADRQEGCGCSICVSSEAQQMESGAPSPDPPLSIADCTGSAWHFTRHKGWNQVIFKVPYNLSYFGLL